MEQMLENAKSEETKVLEARPSVPAPVPEGHVARTFNFKDRLLICMACNSYVMSKGNNNHVGMKKITRIRRVLNADEVDEYFEMIEESYEAKVRAWTRSQNIFRSFEAWKSAAMSERDLLKLFPELDLTKTPDKPPRKTPEATDEEKRGRPRTFHIKANLDVMIEAALTAMAWPELDDAVFIDELSDKYHLPEEGE